MMFVSKKYKMNVWNYGWSRGFCFYKNDNQHRTVGPAFFSYLNDKYIIKYSYLGKNHRLFGPAYINGNIIEYRILNDTVNKINLNSHIKSLMEISK